MISGKGCNKGIFGSGSHTLLLLVTLVAASSSHGEVTVVDVIRLSVDVAIVKVVAFIDLFFMFVIVHGGWLCENPEATWGLNGDLGVILCGC